MNFLKKLAGIIVFVAALAGAVVLTKYYGRPEPARAEPDTNTAAPSKVTDVPVPPPPTAAAAPVVFKPQLITLDFAGRKSYTTVVLERDPSRPAPQKVWVWTYFFTAEAGRERKYCAGEPVEVRWPSADSTRERVTVEAPASACAAPRDASATFYARVNVSAESAFAARLSESKISYDLGSATPVVVQGLDAPQKRK
jgi:hypothetical protein